jgi:dTDP-4-dehydrorhamnose reductase
LENIEDFNFPNIYFDIVFFCAALTSISKCEKFPEKAYKINYENTYKITRYFIEQKSFVILFSTSQVFNGNNKTELVDSIPHPFTTYGTTKALLEKKLVPFYKEICILRCTKIIFKSNELFSNWERNLKLNIPIEPFFDLYFSPISIEYLLLLIDKIIINKVTGIHNISSKYDISYHEASKYIANKLNLNNNLIKSISYKKKIKSTLPQYTNLKNTLYKFYPVPLPVDALDYYLSF